MRLKLPRAPRPSPPRLSAALAVLGLVAGFAFLLMPVEVAFDDDPLLRLQPFSQGLDQVVTEVDCGGALENLGRRSDDLSLYGVARDEACRDAATRRTATAVAAVAVIGLLVLVTVAGGRSSANNPSRDADGASSGVMHR